MSMLLAAMLLQGSLATALREVVDDAPLPVNRKLTRVVEGIVTKQQLPYRFVVRTVRVWKDRGVVNAVTKDEDEGFVIYVSPILLEEMDEVGIREVMAHEIAHLPEACGLNYVNDAEKLACEHKADVLAARWVGRRAVLRGLCQFRQIAFDWRFITDTSPIDDRIRLLHHRKDIP